MEVSEDAALACVMPNESYAKTLAIGAAYFARRRIDQFADIRDDESVNWSRYSECHILSVEPLANSAARRRVLLPAFDQAQHQLQLLRPNRLAPTRRD